MSFSSLHDDFRSEIARIVANLYPVLVVEDFAVGAPPFPEWGHLTTNIALVVAARGGGAPMSIAEAIANRLDRSRVRSVEIKRPGHINIFLVESYLLSKLSVPGIRPPGVLGGRRHVVSRWTDERLVVEHTSPAFPKALHIGHLMNNSIGEFVVRSAQMSKSDSAQGDVLSVSFPSDISPGFAKAMLVFSERHGSYISPALTAAQIVDLLGDCYAVGSERERDGDETFKADVKSTIKELYSGSNIDLTTRYQALLGWCKKYLAEMAGRLGSRLDAFVYESEAGVVGKAVILANIREGCFEESEGAIIHRPTDPAASIAVFLNSDGNPTYGAKDVGLMALKFERFQPTMSIAIVDKEQEGHFRSVFSAVKALGGEYARYVARSKVIFHGRMSLNGSRISSRAGGIPLAHEVLSELTEKAERMAMDRGRGDNAPDGTYATLALSALKVSILKSRPGVSINFDLERSLTFDGDSGPYVQYTHARCCSVLEKARVLGLRGVCGVDGLQVSRPLEVKLAFFDEVVRAAVDGIEPQVMVHYLFELGSVFNSLYNETNILACANPDEQAHLLFLVGKTRETLEAGLYLLGLPSLEQI